jgi:tetratricopeptide (TPR) repeat protein
VIVACCALSGQQRKLDSLKRIMMASVSDTAKVNSLNDLAWEMKEINPDSSMALSNQSLSILEKNTKINLLWKRIATAKIWQHMGSFSYFKGDYKTALDFYTKAASLWNELERAAPSARKKEIQKSESATLGNIAVIYASHGDNAKALEHFHRALKIEERMNDKEGIARNLGNIGLTYSDMDDYPKALDHYFRALKINAEIGNKNGEATVLGNIGIIYSRREDSKKALDYFLRALKLKQELGNKNGTASTLGNIGGVYRVQGELSKALDFYSNSLKLYEEVGNKKGISNQLANIGNVFGQQKNHAEALKFYKRSLEIEEAIKNKAGAATTISNMGSIFLDQEKYSEAEKMFRRSIAISLETGNHSLLRDGYFHLSKIDSARGNYPAAYANYKIYISFRDSISNEESTKKQTQAEMQYDFDKKAAETKALQDKKDAVALAEKRKQNIILWSVVCGLALVVAFAAFILRSYSQKKKANIEISRQKEIIEMKQKEVLDSIHYAKRIQQALITSELYISRSLKKLNGNN